MSEHRYRVVAERSGDWWAISVPDLPGVFSQARRLDQVDAMAREAIALMLDVDETAVAVTIDPTLPPRTAAAVSEALSRRQARRDAEAREQEALRQAGTCARPDPSADLPDPRRVWQRGRGGLAAAPRDLSWPSHLQCRVAPCRQGWRRLDSAHKPARRIFGSGAAAESATLPHRRHPGGRADRWAAGPHRLPRVWLQGERERRCLAGQLREQHAALGGHRLLGESRPARPARCQLQQPGAPRQRPLRPRDRHLQGLWRGHDRPGQRLERDH